MAWHILRYLITFFLPVFYKRVQAKNLANIQVKGPVVIAMNHPNAFTDPIYIAYLSYPQRVMYLARGDAFKPGPAAYLLEKFGVVPIFRLSDAGKEGLKKNDEAYRRVNHLLSRNSKIIVFAEGICVQERRLRPLKKGVARMVFGAYEALNSDLLTVVPVGVNYSKPDEFRSDIFYNVGEPIHVKDFMEEFRANPARANNLLLQTLEPKMKELITHIDDPSNDEAVYHAEQLCKKEWIMEQGLDVDKLCDDFTVLKQLTEKINVTSRDNPAAFAEYKNLATAYFKELKLHRLKDDHIKDLAKITWPVVLTRFAILTLAAPIYLAGLVWNFIPLFLAHLAAKKTIKSKEFYSSIAIGAGMFIFWIWYILWFVVISLVAPTILWPFAICFLMALSGYFSLYYNPFLKNTLCMWRILNALQTASGLAERRKKLVSLINKF